MGNQLILLIGLPGSGKSTLAKRLAAEALGSKIVSPDAIRAELFGDEATQGSWLLVRHQVEHQFRRAVWQMERGEIPGAIYDATNAVRRQRREAIALARATGFNEITGIWLDIPLEVCLERNRHRDRRVPEAVIERMQRRLQGAPPTLEEGLDLLVRYSVRDLAFHHPAILYPLISTEIAIASVSKNRT